MLRERGCPAWYTGHNGEATQREYQVLLGDVRVTRTRAGSTTVTTCSVRREARCTPANSYRLSDNFAAVSNLLRRDAVIQKTVDQVESGPEYALA